MTETELQLEINRLTNRIKELEGQVIQAEDIAKEAYDILAKRATDIEELENELETVSTALSKFATMGFFKRLWWAFTLTM